MMPLCLLWLTTPPAAECCPKIVSSSGLIIMPQPPVAVRGLSILIAVRTTYCVATVGGQFAAEPGPLRIALNSRFLLLPVEVTRTWPRKFLPNSGRSRLLRSQRHPPSEGQRATRPGLTKSRVERTLQLVTRMTPLVIIQRDKVAEATVGVNRRTLCFET